jgi:uncharacterized protein (DUF3084 family)
MLGNDVWVLVPIAAIFAFAFSLRSAFKYGLRRRRWHRWKHDLDDEEAYGRREDIIKQIDAAIASRDETIAKLEERVRVLERIVTDRSQRLSEEIGRLSRT